MSMTRKDFDRLAKAINELRERPWSLKDDDVRKVATVIGAALGGVHDNFIYDRWEAATGTQPRRTNYA